MSTLGAWLKAQGFTVDDNNVPFGRESTWKGVSFLMVHHTVSPCEGKEEDIANYCRKGGTGTYPPLCQIVLGHSGKVWMTCREREGQKDPGRASHAGNGTGYGIAKDTMNEHALGIEVQCQGNHPISTHQTQYAALIKLLAALSKKYGVPVKNIIGHKEWSTTGKVDPRDNMDVIRADVARALSGGTSGGPYVVKDVYRSKCGFGEPTNGDKSSDTVKELQELLKRAKLSGAVTLTVDGKYGPSTDLMVRLWQEQKCNDTPDPENRSYLGPKQFSFMFPASTYTLHDDGDAKIASAPPPVEPPPVKPPVLPPIEPPPVEPPVDPPIVELPPVIPPVEPPPIKPPIIEEPPVTEPPVPEVISFPLGIEYWYSGKPSGTLTIAGGYKKLDVRSWAPKKDGLTFGMLYINVDPTFAAGKTMGVLRARVIREAFKGQPEDPTAYKDFLMIGNWLITHVWFESGEAGRPLHWEMDVRLGMTKAVIGTRYAKFVTIPWIVTLPGANLAKRLTSMVQSAVSQLRRGNDEESV